MPQTDLQLKYQSPAQNITELSRSTLGERAEHAQRVPYFQKGVIRTLFRPGDRTHPEHSNYYDLSRQGFHLGIIQVRGDSTKGIDPIYSWRAPIELLSATPRQFHSLQESDFEGGYPWIKSSESLCNHLREIYPHFEALPTDFVTIYRLNLKS